jgi:phage-related protein (TIGR01555 family)
MPSQLTRQLVALGRDGLNKLSAQFDSWTNDVTGFGTGDDKTTYTRFLGAQLLSQQELSNLYHGDDLAARMVDVVPDEMLREGFAVDVGDQGLNTAIADKLEAMMVDERFANGIRWGRCFGEGAILIGADDGRRASQPLIPERARDVNYLHVMDGRYYWPITYYREAGHPQLGQPETFGVMPPGNSGQPSAIVHETRLIRFGGAPTGDQERNVNLSRDYSVLQRAIEALRAFNTGFKAVEILLTDGHQSVFKMQGLAEMIGSGGEALAMARLKIINLYRSVLRAIVVDAGDKESGVGAEDFSRNSVSFSDIPKTLDSFMLRLAAAVQIPVTILMGQSPAGMNATGESDFRWFYDRIRSEQTRRLAPKIRRLIRVLLATKAWNKPPKIITIKFPPLWSEAPLQAAQTRKTLIEGDTLLSDAGIILPEEVATQRLKPEGFQAELVLTPEGVKVREAVIGREYEGLTPKETKAPIPDIELAPTDAATVIKVNEARASMGMPALEGPDGELTLAEFKAKSAPPSPGFGGPPGGPSPAKDGPPTAVKPGALKPSPEPGKEPPQPADEDEEQT